MIESKQEGRKVRRNKEGVGKKTRCLFSSRISSGSLGRRKKKERRERRKEEARRKEIGNEEKNEGRTDGRHIDTIHKYIYTMIQM
jgi:hypothetical protein